MGEKGTWEGRQVKQASWLPPLSLEGGLMGGTTGEKGAQTRQASQWAA